MIIILIVTIISTLSCKTITINDINFSNFVIAGIIHADTLARMMITSIGVCWLEGFSDHLEIFNMEQPNRRTFSVRCLLRLSECIYKHVHLHHTPYLRILNTIHAIGNTSLTTKTTLAIKETSEELGSLFMKSVYIDLDKSRRPSPFPDWFLTKYRNNLNTRAIQENNPLDSSFAWEENTVEPFITFIKVRYSDIDVNMHLNAGV